MEIEPKAMREIHEIQEIIHSEQKNMTDIEKLESIKREAREVKHKFGLKVRRTELKIS